MREQDRYKPGQSPSQAPSQAPGMPLWARIGRPLVIAAVMGGLAWFLFGETEPPGQSTPAPAALPAQTCEGYPEALMREPALLTAFPESVLAQLESGQQLYGLESLTLTPPEAPLDRALWWRRWSILAHVLVDAQEISVLAQQRYLLVGNATAQTSPPSPVVPVNESQAGATAELRALPEKGLLYHWLQLELDALNGPIPADNPVLAEKAGWRELQAQVRTWAASAPLPPHERALAWSQALGALQPTLETLRGSSVEPSGALLRGAVLAQKQWLNEPVGTWAELLRVQTPDYVWTTPAQAGRDSFQIERYDASLYRVLAAEVLARLLAVPVRNPVEGFYQAELRGMARPELVREAFCQWQSEWQSEWQSQWQSTEGGGDDDKAQGSAALAPVLPYLLHSDFLSMADLRGEAGRRCTGVPVPCPEDLEAVQDAVSDIQAWQASCYATYARQSILEQGQSRSLEPEAKAIAELHMLDGPARRQLLLPAFQSSPACSAELMDDLLRRWRGADRNSSAWSDVRGVLAWIKLDVARGAFSDGLQELRNLSSAQPLLLPAFELVRSCPHSRFPGVHNGGTPGQ